jgi:uncharacterized protein (DUF3820 family)
VAQNTDKEPSMSIPDRCPHCDSRNLITTRSDVPEPHHGKLVCGQCGKWLRWLAGPVADFRMPFGRYRGSTLAEIDHQDREYLIWIARNADFSNPKVQGKVKEYLGSASTPDVTSQAKSAT